MKNGIKAKDIREFEKLTGKLAALISRIRETVPEANLYVAGNEIYLCSGDTAELDYEEQAKLVVATSPLMSIDGGDW